MPKRVLVVAAHADDDVLGCGGTIAKWAVAGIEVFITFMTDGVGSRDNATPTAEITARQVAARAAVEILGGRICSFGKFPDNAMDTVPLIEIVKYIERIIADVRPDTVLTHHSGDVNIDHRKVHDALSAACRPQRGHPVKSIRFFEVASSTEWQFPGSASQFSPNWFEDISLTLGQKLAALECYESEVRDWPHPRSVKAVEYLARWRGASSGFDAAEAFVLGRHIS